MSELTDRPDVAKPRSSDVALVTAASSGIGAACARRLAGRGYRVALMSRSEAIEELAHETEGVFVRGSVTNDSDVDRAVEACVGAYGQLDVAVVSTGHAGWSTEISPRRVDDGVDTHLLDIPTDDWHEAFELYFLGAVRVARAVTPLMVRGGGGTIVNVSASSAREPSPAYPMSSTVRRALTGFTKLYADRYARHGIRMNNVLPGYLDNWEWPDEFIDSIPMGRAGTVEEVADAVAFLVSKEAAYISGQDLLIDGAYVRGP